MDTLSIAKKIVKICDTTRGNDRLFEISKVIDGLKEERETFGAYENLCELREIIDSKINIIDEEGIINKGE